MVCRIVWAQTDLASIFDPAIKERVDFFRVDRMDGVFKSLSFLRVSIRLGSTGGIYAIVETW